MALRDDVTRGGLAAVGTARAACCREDFEKFGLVVCSMEGDAFIPLVLSAEMLLSSRKCLAWFDGRETWLERGGVGSGCVC